MRLHELKPNNPLKGKKPRVGRGGKRGTTSGKGTKGQKSRSGRRIRPGERDLLQRLPKLRGIKHKPVSQKLDVLNISEIPKYAKDGVLNEEILGKKVKILGNGEIKTAVKIKGLPMSKSAKEKITAAGGNVE